MPDPKPSLLVGDFQTAVTAESGRSPGAVEAVLEKHGLRDPTLIPTPVSITLRKLLFSGVRPVEGAESGKEEFTFSWDNLEPGLWLIGSDRNSAGKTSLVEIMRWLLRGSPSSALPGPVKDMLRKVALEFDVGEVRYRISLDLTDGLQAELVELRAGGSGLPRFRVDQPKQFEAAMSDFMMSALGLDPIVAWKKAASPDAEGYQFAHGWLALMGAFHIGTNYGALLGEETWDGLQPRMLNMFAGFPHASLVNRIAILQKAVVQTADNDGRARLAVAEHARVRADSLRVELEALGQTAETASAAAEALEDARTSSEQVGHLYARRPQLSSHLAAMQVALLEAQEEYNADRIAFQDFVDGEAASLVFRSLNPKCCPRCDQAFKAERRLREARELACMVCGEDAPVAAEDADAADARRTGLEAVVAASRKALEAARAAETRAKQAVEVLDQDITSLEAKLQAARTRQGAQAGAADLAMRRAVLTARLADAEKDADVGKTKKSEEAIIVGACDKVARARLAEEQRDVLAAVGDEMARLLRVLGLDYVKRVELNSQGHLTVHKDTGSSNFGKLSEGEKLRAKIVAVLALMKVANQRSVGRHPGILFIDTPGAQEVAPKDLEALARGLAEAVAELQGLQIFVATRLVAEFSGVVPPAHRRVATGEARLW
jgi:hypothetical protein